MTTINEETFATTGDAMTEDAMMIAAPTIPVGTAATEATMTTTTGTTTETIAGETIALFNVDGRLFALDDACIRCGSSLALGVLVSTSVEILDRLDLALTDHHESPR